MPPRPILKGLPSSSYVSSDAVSSPLPFSTSSTVLDSPHVHFPPTPTLTSTEITHSPFIYDRAPIVVTPNTCALPERGGRKFVGSNSNKGGGLGYFHPHAQFQVDAGRDSSETSGSPALFSANVTVGNVNDRGSLGLFMKKRPGSMYDYDHDREYDQQSSDDKRTQRVLSSLFHRSPESSDLGVFCSPPTPPSSSSSSLSIPPSSVNFSPWNVYSSTAPPSPNSNSNNNNHHMASERQVERDAGGKRRRKSSKDYSRTRVEGDRMRDSGTTTSSDSFELEGCLGGF